MVEVGGRGVRGGALACLAFAVSLAVTGCLPSSATPEVIYTTPPGVDSSVAGPTPSIEGIVITTAAPDNSWSVTFKKPVVSGVSSGSDQKMNDAITAQVNAYIHAFNGGKLPTVPSGGSPSTLQGDFSIAQASSTILSLRFSVVTTLSGADKTTFEPRTINFWAPTGAAIDVSELFTDPNAALATIADQAHKGLSSKLGDVLTWNGKADAWSFFQAWDMTVDGLEFSWARGKVAGESAGMASVTLPWSGLKSIIRTNGPAAAFVK
jgi:hypothetical protein